LTSRKMKMTRIVYTNSLPWSVPFPVFNIIFKIIILNNSIQTSRQTSYSIKLKLS
jgi:hypothetical protein